MKTPVPDVSGIARSEILREGLIDVAMGYLTGRSYRKTVHRTLEMLSFVDACDEREADETEAETFRRAVRA